MGWQSRGKECRATSLIGAGVLAGALMLTAMKAPPEEGETNGGGAGLSIVLYPFAALAIGGLLFVRAAIAGSN